MKLKRFSIALFSFVIGAAACSSSATNTQTIRLLTHKQFHLPLDALEEFTAKTGIEVLVFTEEDATSMVSLLEKSSENPVADVVLGIDSLERRRASEKRLVEAYKPIGIENVDETLLLQDELLTPVSQLAACLNRSKSRYLSLPRRLDELPDKPTRPLEAPDSFSALTDPRHAPTAVVPDPLESRMGLYFLVALERAYPENTVGVEPWPKVLEQMLRSGVEIAPSWEEAWFTRFQPTAQESEDDPRSLTWGSAGMPAVSVRFMPELPEEVDVAVINSGCIKVVNYAGIVRNTPDRRNAGRLLDSFLEPLFQYQVPDRYGSQPARTDILRTEAWKRFGVKAKAIPLDEWRIGPIWEQWLMTWRQVSNEVKSGREPVPPVVTVTIPSQ